MNSLTLSRHNDKTILTLDAVRLQSVLEYQIEEAAGEAVELTIKMKVTLNTSGD